MNAILLKPDWNDLAPTGPIRRNPAGLAKAKELARLATSDAPVVFNAFFYASLRPTTNIDLLRRENMTQVSGLVEALAARLPRLEAFERTGRGLQEGALRTHYLALRRVIVRANARDERRVLATLLFSGPSSAQNLARDLPGLGEGLAARILVALDPVLEIAPDTRSVLQSDADRLAVVLYLLRSTLGIDPIAVLQRRLAAIEEIEDHA